MAKKANASVEANVLPAGYVPTLKKVYKEEIVDKLMKQFGYKSVMQIPKLDKVVINLTLSAVIVASRYKKGLSH